MLQNRTNVCETFTARKNLLKDRSRVAIIVDYSRDYTALNGA